MRGRREHTVRQSKELTADDLMGVCGETAGKRVLRYKIRRGIFRPMSPDRHNILRLGLDVSGICHLEENTRMVLRTCKSNKKFLVVMEVPLQEEISDDEALMRGRQAINACFATFTALEASTGSNRNRKRRPERPTSRTSLQRSFVGAR